MSNTGLMPKGWIRVPLGEIARINPRGFDTEPGEEEHVSFVSMTLVEAGSGHLDSSNSRLWRDVKKGYTRFQENDVLFAKITPCMENAKCALAANLISGRGAGSTEFHVFRPTAAILPKYILYYLLQERVRREAKLSMRGAAGQLRVPPEFIARLETPVAPVPEQARIIEEIEKQFTRLDAAVAALKRVQTNLKRYRAAVLKTACEGRLVPTEAELARREDRSYEPGEALISRLRASATSAKLTKRRAGRLWGAGVIPELMEAERAILPEGWAWTKVRDLGNDPDNVVQVGPMSMRSQDFEDNGVPVFNVGCVKWGEFDESKLNYLPEGKAMEFDRYRIAVGDVLFTRSGAVGRCAVAKDHHSGWLMTFHLLRARTNGEFCLPEFLRVVFEGASHIGRQTRAASVGTTRAGFNTNLLAGLDVPLPPYSEQIRIMAEIDRRLTELNALQATVRTDLKRSEKLRQAVLKHAFEGQLVPQDPNDEPARILLDRIRADRNVAHKSTPTSPRGRRKKEAAHVE